MLADSTVTGPPSSGTLRTAVGSSSGFSITLIIRSVFDDPRRESDDSRRDCDDPRRESDESRLYGNLLI